MKSSRFQVQVSLLASKRHRKMETQTVVGMLRYVEVFQITRVIVEHCSRFKLNKKFFVFIAYSYEIMLPSVVLFGQFLSKHLRWRAYLTAFHLRCFQGFLIRLCTESLPFFNCSLAVPRPTLGHFRGDGFTNPMLISALSTIS